MKNRLDKISSMDWLRRDASLHLLFPPFDTEAVGSVIESCIVSTQDDALPRVVLTNIPLTIFSCLLYIWVLVCETKGCKHGVLSLLSGAGSAGMRSAGTLRMRPRKQEGGASILLPPPNQRF